MFFILFTRIEQETHWMGASDDVIYWARLLGKRESVMNV